MTDVLWSRRQCWTSGLLVAAGFAVVAWSWWGASGELTLSQQHGWIALGVAGVALVAAGSFSWLWSARRQVSNGLSLLHGWLPPAAPQLASATPAVPVLSLPVAAEGMHLYHRPACQFAVGKGTRSATPAEHERVGRAPCPVCRP